MIGTQVLSSRTELSVAVSSLVQRKPSARSDSDRSAQSMDNGNGDGSPHVARLLGFEELNTSERRHCTEAKEPPTEVFEVDATSNCHRSSV